jgi:hypothetical protein
MDNQEGQSHKVLLVSIDGGLLARALHLSIADVLGFGLGLTHLEVLATIKHESVLVHWLGKLGKQWIPINAVPLGSVFWSQGYLPG